MQTYDVGMMELVVNGKDMVPGEIMDAGSDLLMEFGDLACLCYNRKTGTLSGSGVKLEYSPADEPFTCCRVHLHERGKQLADMKVVAVLRTAHH